MQANRIAFVKQRKALDDSKAFCLSENGAVKAKKASRQMPAGLKRLGMIRVRFELTTHGLEDRCSIQLSYWHIINNY